MHKKEVTAEVEISKVLAKVWTPLIASVLTAVVLFAGYYGYTTFQKSREAAAQEKLFTLQKKIEDKKQELQKAEDAKKEESAKADPKKADPKKVVKKTDEEVKTPELLKSRFGEVLADYETFIQNNEGHKAASMAAVQLAGLSLDYNDLDMAEKVLAQVAKDLKPTEVFAGLVLSQLGTVYLDKKKYTEAIEQFNNIVESKDLSSFHPQALLRLGATYFESGNFEKANEAWAQLEKDHPLTQAAEQAKGYKKLAALKKGAKL